MSATNASQSLSNVFCLFVFNVANSTPVGHNQVLKLNRTKISERITLGNKSIYNRSVCVYVCVCVCVICNIQPTSSVDHG